MLAGAGWDDKPMPANVALCRPSLYADHNAFNASALAVLNVSRDSMAAYGYSPATRVFEAAGAGACIITDAWEGIAMFFEPGREILVAENGPAVAEHLARLTLDEARRIGAAARARALAEHTYARRVALVEDVLAGRRAMNAGAGNGSGRRARPLRIVILGLSITSSWGNGHATTYRGLMRALCRRGHEVLFLECDKPWYRAHRDMTRLALRDRAPLRRCRGIAAALGRRDAATPISSSSAPMCRTGSRSRAGCAAVATGIVAFYDIDTPVTLAALADGTCPYLDAALDPGLRSLPVVHRRAGAAPARNAATARAPRGPSIAASIPERHRPCPAGEPRWELGYLGTYSADRQPALDALLCEPARRWPEGRFAVAGPLYPADLRWPANVERIEHVGPDRHPWFYGRQRFTLNVTRADMVRLGLFAERAAVRGGGLRRADHQRLVAGSRRRSSSPAAKS